MNTREIIWFQDGNANQWVTEQGLFLKGCFSDINSQFGEDGLIAATFDRIGTANRWCFEVGAADGVFYSNTLELRNQRWNAVLIEQDAELFGKLKSFQSDTVRCFHESITGAKLDRILYDCGAPKDPDLGVIDVDGQDYWVWKRFEDHAPRVMLVEFGYYADPSIIPIENPSHFYDGDTQANWQQICALGAQKGYTPLARTFCNLLFIQEAIEC